MYFVTFHHCCHESTVCDPPQAQLAMMGIYYDKCVLVETYLWLVSVRVDCFNIEEKRLNFTPYN